MSRATNILKDISKQLNSCESIGHYLTASELSTILAKAIANEKQSRKNKTCEK
jgi:hypothetical protein